MTKREKFELAEIIAVEVVKALRAEAQPSAEGKKSANEGKKSANEDKKSAKKLTIADFEPRGSKCKEGYMNWSSYKSQRTKYCYFVATNGEVTDGKVYGTKWYGKVDFSENSKYYKAKAQYEKKYHYIKVEDRK